MPHIVIADDLTGANDCAYHLKQATQSASVIHTYAPLEEATVINTDTRNKEKSIAKKIVADNCARANSNELYDYQRSILFKKIDSTLRGNVYAELKAMQHALSLKKIFICPAYPEIDRIVHDGKLIVEGIPMHKHPIYGQEKDNAEIASVIKNSAIATEDDYIQGTWMNDIANNTNPYLILDATTDTMLEYVAQKTIAYARRHPTVPMAWCGSAKFLEMLLRQFPHHKERKKEEVKPAITKIMLIIGSLNPITRAQYEKVKPLWQNSYSTPAQWQDDVSTLQHECKEKAKESLSKGCNTILTSGGDTAAQIWQALGYPTLHCIGSLATHIPLFQMIYKGNTVYMATKSGGFGNENILQEVYEQWQS